MTLREALSIPFEFNPKGPIRQETLERIRQSVKFVQARACYIRSDGYKFMASIWDVEYCLRVNGNVVKEFHSEVIIPKQNGQPTIFTNLGDFDSWEELEKSLTFEYLVPIKSGWERC